MTADATSRLQGPVLLTFRVCVGGVDPAQTDVPKLPLPVMLIVHFPPDR